MDPKIITLTARLEGKLTTQQMDSRDWLVAPAVVLVPGVLNGALVPIEEVQRHVEAWNGRPVPVNHPQANGLHVSASQPELEDVTNIGRVYGARFEDGKLKAELWLDQQKANRLGFANLIQRLQSGNEPMELSSAYFTDIDDAEGAFQGQSYKGIHRNLRPDHVALLPDEIGACSVAGGCGVPRVNNSRLRQAMSIVTNALFGHGQEAGHRKLEERLFRRLTGEGNPRRNIAVIDVLEDNTFIYRADSYGGGEEDPMRLFRRGYEINGEEVSLGEQITEVQVRESVDYVPVTANKQESSTMDRDKTITSLIANEKTPWQESDRKTLAALTDDQIKALDCGCPQVNAQQTTQVVQQELPLPPQVQAMAARYDRQKAEVLGRLKANKRCKMTESQLAGLDLDALEALESSLRPGDYSGRGMATHRHEEEDGVPEPIAVLTAIDEK